MESENKSIFSNIVKSFGSSVKSLFLASEIDDDFFDELEELLVMSDVGVDTSLDIIDKLKERINGNNIKKLSDAKQILKDIIIKLVDNDIKGYDFESNKGIIFITGINGVGKTTTVAKLCKYLQNKNKKVLLACLDTYRAAANTQLEIWADKLNVKLISDEEGSDSGAVLYNALNYYKKNNFDFLICDNSGRLHNNINLMRELSKLDKIIEKNIDDIHVEKLLVIDSMSGQNGLNQAIEFNRAVENINGIILSKLDGSSKGGIIISIKNKLGIPVKYIGYGENIEDFDRFKANDFANTLL